MSTVSVIVPTRDRPSFLEQAIASILRLKDAVAPEAEVEVIVVDDGSKEQTAELVARFPIRYLRNQGRGVSAARNLGIRCAAGEFVAFLDDDDVWLDGHLTPHLQILKRQPGVALVYAQGALADAQLMPVQPATPRPPLASGDVFAYFLGFCAPLNTVVVRRSALLEVGLFDERLQWAEDWDLEMRLASRFDCAGVAVPVSLYRQHKRATVEPDYWARRYAQTMAVVQRGMRLASRTPAPLRRRLLVPLMVRGWFAYQQLASAQEDLRQGKRTSARAGLVGVARVSPLHACFRLPGFWSTAFAVLAPELGRGGQ